MLTALPTPQTASGSASFLSESRRSLHRIEALGTGRCYDTPMQPRIPINPPRPPYEVREGTDVSVAPVGRPQESRPHRMQRTLQFNSVLCNHGDEVTVFRHGEWNILVPTVSVTHYAHAVIYALKFEFRLPNRQLIIWPDEYGTSPWLRPTDCRKTILDVEAGDTMMWYRCSEPMRVAEIATYRTNLPAHGETVVRSGRSYLNSPHSSSLGAW